ncbi:MAG TPA: Y-family DNA polymerase [Alphaproteobacteria bacterium]|nr:Y-family DNA polymerase [Alphaproteobacteria bacterium]
MIGLLDANSFFASCEKTFRPDLWGKPVLVLSNNDGCVIARCPYVKKLGIPMGAPFFKIEKLVKEHNISVFSSNFSLYKDMSQRMMRLIKETVPTATVYSIDEAFIDFKGINDPVKLAKILRKKVSKGLGLPTAIGIAPTKTLAKVANHIAKQTGVCFLKDTAEIDEVLKILPLSDVWGVGKRTSQKLQKYGITTAYDLKNVDPKWMRRLFTVTGERLVLELNGIPCFQDLKSSRQSFQSSRSFETPLKTFDELKQRIHTHVTTACSILRNHHLKAKKITVFMTTNRFKEEVYSNESTKELPYAGDDTLTFLHASTAALQSIFKEGPSYTKAGIILHELYKKTEEILCLELFDDYIKKPSLDPVLDLLNKRFGAGTIHFVSCLKGLSLIGKKKFTSPSYTTKWDDILVVGG